MMTLPVMAQYAAQKGLDILTASDFTHPVWFKGMREQLEESAEGLYTLKVPFDFGTNENGPFAQGEKETLFLLSREMDNLPIGKSYTFLLKTYQYLC